MNTGVEPPGMPAALAEIRNALWQDVVFLHLKWNMFCTLQRDKESVDLLNFGSEFYFGVNQMIWAEHMQVAISRLTDPPQMCKYENLCLKRLLLHIDQVIPVGVHTRVESLLKELDVLCKPIRDRRMKLFAHFDLDTKLERNSIPLDTVSKGVIDSTMEKIRDIMNAVDEAYLGVPTTFDYGGDTDAAELLYHLNDAREYQRQERIRFGQPPDPEIKPEV